MKKPKVLKTKNKLSKIESKRDTRKAYSLIFKKVALKHFECTKSKNLSAQNLKIPRQTLQAWVKQGKLSQKVPFKGLIPTIFLNHMILNNLS
jgi:hypothetical protein